LKLVHDFLSHLLEPVGASLNFSLHFLGEVNDIDSHLALYDSTNSMELCDMALNVRDTYAFENSWQVLDKDVIRAF
jgi:hypothetical protein